MVPGFKDTKGREWVFPELTEGAIIRLRSDLGYDLHLVMDQNDTESSKVFSAKGFAELSWYFLRGACDEADVDQMDLGDAINHKVKADIQDALIEMIMSFFHGPDAGKKIATALRPVKKNLLAKSLTALKKQYGGSPESSE